MDDDDVEAVEVTEPGTSEGGGKPLMRLFKRLIGNDNKQNTVLTNSQIINILKREFQIDIDNLHELEVEIYLNVMKKYLKEWPQWDEFDQVINNLKAKGEFDEISKILVLKYMDLKDFIKLKLDKVRPLAENAVKNATGSVDRGKEFLNVVMEVSCSRQQLNTLFLRRPHPAQNTIFNVVQATPSRITVETLEYKDMFFWPSIAIEIKTNRSTLTWQTIHELKHVLVNKRLHFPRKTTPFDHSIYEKSKTEPKPRICGIASINQFLDQVLKLSYSTSYVPMYSVELLIQIIRRDLELLPHYLDVQSKYKRILTKYPLVRYLYTDVSDANSEVVKKYDIQLEETMIPQSQISLQFGDPPNGFKSCTISVKCLACTESYQAHNMLEMLKQHILSEHFDEPDWQCTNCKETLSMVLWARGKHVCAQK